MTNPTESLVARLRTDSEYMEPRPEATTRQMLPTAKRPSFPLIDNDPASHMWVIASVMRKKFGQDVMATYIEEYAGEKR